MLNITDDITQLEIINLKQKKNIQQWDLLLVIFLIRYLGIIRLYVYIFLCFYY